MTAIERNLHVLGQMLAIADEAAPALKRHFHKHMTHPQILFVQMGLDRRVNKAWANHPELTVQLDSTVKPMLPAYANPHQQGVLVAGFYHANIV